MDAKTTAHILLSQGHKVIFTFRRNTSFSSTEHSSLFEDDLKFGGSVDYVECDITDKFSIDFAMKFVSQKYSRIDEVYLLAAQSNVGYSFKAPEVTFLTTGLSVFYFLDWFYNNSAESKVFVAMTSELFGGKHEKPCTEDSVFDCRSPYSIAKESASRWVKYYRQLGLFCCYAISYNHSNCYRGHDFFIRRVTSAAARIATGKQKSLELGNLDFCRDETWADFMCEGFVDMLKMESPEDLLLASGRTNHGEEYLDNAFGYFNMDWREYVVIDKGRFRPNEVSKLIGDPSKAVKSIGWDKNRMSFSKHVESMCKWDYELESGRKPKREDFLKKFPKSSF